MSSGSSALCQPAVADVPVDGACLPVWAGVRDTPGMPHDLTGRSAPDSAAQVSAYRSARSADYGRCWMKARGASTRHGAVADWR